MLLRDKVQEQHSHLGRHFYDRDLDPVSIELELESGGRGEREGGREDG